jgi:hypothetical protein
MPNVDFNTAMLILDTLTEDRVSFVELDDYIGRHHGRDAISTALKMLNDRGLIVILEGPDAPAETSRESWPGKLADFFALARLDRADAASHFIEISTRGEQVMDLFGIGAP